MQRNRAARGTSVRVRQRRRSENRAASKLFKSLSLWRSSGGEVRPYTPQCHATLEKRAGGARLSRRLRGAGGIFRFHLAEVLLLLKGPGPLTLTHRFPGRGSNRICLPISWRSIVALERARDDNRLSTRAATATIQAMMATIFAAFSSLDTRSSLSFATRALFSQENSRQFSVGLSA